MALFIFLLSVWKVAKHSKVFNLCLYHPLTENGSCHWLFFLKQFKNLFIVQATFLVIQVLSWVHLIVRVLPRFLKLYDHSKAFFLNYNLMINVLLILKLRSETNYLSIFMGLRIKVHFFAKNLLFYVFILSFITSFPSLDRIWHFWSYWTFFGRSLCEWVENFIEISYFLTDWIYLSTGKDQKTFLN